MIAWAVDAAERTQLQNAMTRVLAFSATATAEDYRLCGVSVAPPPQVRTYIGIPKAKPFHLNPTNCRKLFPRNIYGTGAIIELSLTTLFNDILCRAPTPWEWHLLAINVGAAEWSLAAVIMGMNAIHPELREYMVAHRMHDYPLIHWSKIYANWLNALRRCPYLTGLPNVPPEDVLQLRKLFTCTIRTNEEADWLAETKRRTARIPSHLGLHPDGSLSAQAWSTAFGQAVREITAEVVQHAAPIVAPTTLQDFWSRRARWGGAGSSSNRRRLHDLVEDDQRIASNARPNKKAVFQTLPKGYLHRLLLQYPPIMIARVSTKPEPGGKQRAIYAVHDEAQLGPAYATADLEKHMNVRGMKVRQTPADVVNWLRDHHAYHPHGIWLSLDYSDFNTEHQLRDMAYIDLAFAGQWLRQRHVYPAAIWKAVSALWSAEAYHSCWVSYPDAQLRIFAGLFSGERHTARNNTIMHAAYAHAIEGFSALLDPSFVIKARNYTGDDEDVLLTKHAHVVLYTWLHSWCGFELKPAKQLVGHTYHEYLQRMIVQRGAISRPLFSPLAQLASGNWYHEVHIYYDAMVTATSDNLWELHLRGLNIVWARRWAVSILQRVMRTRVPGLTGWRELEWWSYRMAPQQPHPLWYGTIGPLALPPTLPQKPTPSRTAPVAASNELATTLTRGLDDAAPTLHAAIVADTQRESYASLYVHQRLADNTTAVIADWPKRHSQPQGLGAALPPSIPDSVITRLALRGEPGHRRPTHEELFATLGIEPAMIRHFGSFWRTLQRLPPKRWARLETPQEAQTAPLQAMRMDPAIRAWLMQADACTLVLHLADANAPHWTPAGAGYKQENHWLYAVRHAPYPELVRWTDTPEITWGERLTPYPHQCSTNHLEQRVVREHAHTVLWLGKLPTNYPPNLRGLAHGTYLESTQHLLSTRD